MKSDTRIYRYFDFFALVDTIRNQRLRFSAPSSFPDKNEGLEIIYNSLIAAIQSRDGSYQGIQSQDEILRMHDILKQGSFVSSWTSDGDSIAMWSLYSEDKCGVRISSTVSKLKAAIDDFASQNSMQLQFNRYGLIEAPSFVFVNGAGVREVIYKDLRVMYENIIRDRLQDQSDQKPHDNFDFLTLKDKAFKHEGEIRGIVTCGLAGSGSNFAESAPWLNGDNLHVNIADDFIESVAIDPRCPRYKRKIIEDYVRDNNISASTSDAFGYLPDKLDFVTPKFESIKND